MFLPLDLHFVVSTWSQHTVLHVQRIMDFFISLKYPQINEVRNSNYMDMEVSVDWL